MLLPLDTAVMDWFAARKPYAVRSLLWLKVRDRTTGAVVEVGFWNGEDDMAIDVVEPSTESIVTRTFVAGGPALQFLGVEDAAGLDIAPVEVSLSAIDATVATAVRGYEMRAAPMEIYLGFKDPEARGFLAPPRVVFEGVVNNVAIPDPAPGGAAEMTLSGVPLTRLLTIGRPGRLSDAEQQARAGDRILRYADTAHLVPLSWGQKTARVAGARRSRT